jgi:hypothetical protein
MEFTRPHFMDRMLVEEEDHDDDDEEEEMSQTKSHATTPQTTSSPPRVGALTARGLEGGQAPLPATRVER